MSEREVDMNKRTSNGILVAQRGYQLSSSVVWWQGNYTMSVDKVIACLCCFAVDDRPVSNVICV